MDNKGTPLPTTKVTIIENASGHPNGPITIVHPDPRIGKIPVTADQFRALRRKYDLDADGTDSFESFLTRVAHGGVGSDCYRDEHGSGIQQSLHRHAIQQMAQTTDLPIKFIDGLQNTRERWAKELLAHNLTTMFANRFAKNRYLLRSVLGEVRGFLSDRYRRLDSRPIIEAFATEVQRLYDRARTADSKCARTKAMILYYLKARGLVTPSLTDTIVHTADALRPTLAPMWWASFHVFVDGLTVYAEGCVDDCLQGIRSKSPSWK